MFKVAQIKYFYFLLMALLLSSCLSNTVNVKPNNEEYTQLVNTPVYIKKAAGSDQNNYEIELSQCLDASNLKAERSSKVFTGIGSIWLVGGLYTISAASGIFAPIAVAAGTMGTILGGSTIIVSKATEEFREYASLEECLEGLGHEVIFYDARKEIK